MKRILNAVCTFFAWLSPRGADACGRSLGSLFPVIIRHQWQRACQHLAMCYPDWPADKVKATARAVFTNMGRNTVELLRWMGGSRADIEQRITSEGLEHVDRCLQEGRGALILTAHLGNWDIMGLWAAGRYPLTIISKEMRNDGVNAFWMEKRAASGLKIVPSRNSYRACLSVLKKNGLLGFIFDQNMTRMDGIFVDFFGRPACTTPGLAMLSAHAQSPVVPVFMVRRPDGSQVVRGFKAIPPPADRSPETIKAATQAYTAVIERMVREHPDQWIWMHRRWRTQPLPGQSAQDRQTH